MAQSFAYIDNTNSLILTGLQSVAENEYLNNVTPTVTVKDSEGNDVTGEAWPLEMSYIEASNGNYQVALSAALEFEDGEKYTAIIDVDASDTSEERIGHWEFGFTGKVRKV